MKWIVEDGVLKLFWLSPEDLVAFVEGVVGPSAKAFGIEITTKKVPAKKLELARPQ